MSDVTDYLNSAPADMATPELMDAAARHWSEENHTAKTIAEAVAWALALPEALHRPAIASIFHRIPGFIDPAELQASFDAVPDPALRELAVKSLDSDTARRLPKPE